MEKNLKIGDVMTPAPHTVGSEQTLTFALAQMDQHGFRHLPVLHGGQLAGIISSRDLGVVAGLNSVDPDQTKVEEAMTTDVEHVGRDEPLANVIETMRENKLGSVLVVEKGKVIGIFTTHDAVTLLSRWMNS